MPRPKSSRDRLEEVKEPKKVCFVATEDSKTGAFKYFDEFSQINKYRFLRKYSFRLTVLPSCDGRTSPSHVLENISSQIKCLKIDGVDLDDDQFWIICDVDRWELSQIEAVLDECDKEGVKYAFSNPCFEIWLLYHQKEFSNAPPFESSEDCKKTAGELLERRGKYENLLTDLHLGYACRHAEASHRPKSQKWPELQGTHVYKLIKYLVD